MVNQISLESLWGHVQQFNSALLNHSDDTILLLLIKK
jgi:hypothetical protein